MRSLIYELPRNGEKDILFEDRDAFKISHVQKKLHVLHTEWMRRSNCGLR